MPSRATRATALSLLAFMLATGFLTNLVQAQQPPYPETLDGTLAVPALRVGDAGVYTVSHAEDTGKGFQDLGDEQEFMRFEVQPDRLVPSVEGPDRLAHVVRTVHHGWIWGMDISEGRTFDEEIHVTADWNGTYGMTGYDVQIYEDGSSSSNKDVYAGNWGQLPCFFVNGLQGRTVNLADEGLSLERSCWLTGWISAADMPAVAQGRLGPFDATVFHLPRDGLDHGESWVWMSDESPVPLAIIVQDTGRPRLFTVYRLTHFTQGPAESPGPALKGQSESWAAPSLAALTRFGPVEPEWVAFGVADAMEVASASEQGPAIEAWLDEHPAAVLTSTWALEPDVKPEGTTFELYLSLQDDSSHASVGVRHWEASPVVTDTSPLAPVEDILAPVKEMVMPPTQAEPDSVTFTTSACECGPVPPLDREYITLAAVAERWAAFAGTDAAPTRWDFDLLCGWNCSSVDLQLSVYLSNRTTQAGQETVYQEQFGMSQSLDPEYPMPIAMMSREFRSTTQTNGSPRQGVDASPIAQVVGVAEVLTILRDAGVLDLDERSDGPSTDEIPGGRNAIRADATGLSGAAVAPPSDDAFDFAKVARGAAGAAVLGAVAIAAWKLLGIGALFSRIERDRLLDHPVRARIHEVVEAQPGIHYSALVRTVGKSKGVVTHHLAKLTDGGLVHAVAGKGATTYFVKGSREGRDVRQASTAIASVARRTLLRAIAAEQGISPSQAAQRLGLAASTVSHHVQHLQQAGLVDVDRQAGRVRLSATPLGSQTAMAGAA